MGLDKRGGSDPYSYVEGCPNPCCRQCWSDINEPYESLLINDPILFLDLCFKNLKIFWLSGLQSQALFALHLLNNVL